MSIRMSERMAKASMYLMILLPPKQLRPWRQATCRIELKVGQCFVVLFWLSGCPSCVRPPIWRELMLLSWDSEIGQGLCRQADRHFQIVPRPYLSYRSVGPTPLALIEGEVGIILRVCSSIGPQFIYVVSVDGLPYKIWRPLSACAAWCPLFPRAVCFSPFEDDGKCHQGARESPSPKHNYHGTTLDV